MTLRTLLGAAAPVVQIHVPNDAWAVVAAALGGSALTGGAALGVEWVRSRLAGRSSRREKVRQCCSELNSHAIALALRAHSLMTTAALQTGLPFAVNALLHNTKHLDVMTVSELFMVDFAPMLAAQATLELLGDVEVIKGGSLVIFAANDVLKAAGALDRHRQDELAKLKAENMLKGLAEYFRQTKVPPELDREFQIKTTELGREVRRFARLVREHLGIESPDAVIKAYPELFAVDPPDGTI